MAAAYYWHGNVLEKVYLTELEFKRTSGFKVLLNSGQSKDWPNSSSYTSSEKGWKPIQFGTFKDLMYATIKVSYDYGVNLTEFLSMLLISLA